MILCDNHQFDGWREFSEYLKNIAETRKHFRIEAVIDDEAAKELTTVMDRWMEE